MSLVRTIVSAIFALIAVPLFTFAACNIAAQAAFLNRATYDDILEDDVIFEDLVSVALPVILSAPDVDNIEFEGRSESPILFRDLVRAFSGKPEVWEEVTNLLVPPSWIQQTLTELVDVLFAISEGDLDVIENPIDVNEVKDRFSSGQVSEAARLIITEAPDCTDEEEAELETFFSEKLGVMPICKAADEARLESSITVVELWFRALAANLTIDEPTVGDIFGLTRDEARGFNLLIELSHQGLILTYLCPLAFLCLVVMLTVRSMKGFGRQLGGTVIVSGLAILLLIFMMQAVVFSIVTNTLSTTSEAEQFFARLFSVILRSIFAQASTSMLMQAAIFIGIGFVLLVIAAFSGREATSPESSFIITEDGQIISTATQKRIGKIDQQ